MRSQEMRKPTVATVSFQGETRRVTQFGVIVAQADARSKYKELRAQAQADFLAYREAGGTLEAMEWVYTFRPELFNLWVSCNSRGGHHDARPAFGRTRRDGERLVRGG